MDCGLHKCGRLARGAKDVLAKAAQEVLSEIAPGVQQYQPKGDFHIGYLVSGAVNA